MTDSTFLILNRHSYVERSVHNKSRKPIRPTAAWHVSDLQVCAQAHCYHYYKLGSTGYRFHSFQCSFVIFFINHWNSEIYVLCEKTKGCCLWAIYTYFEEKREAPDYDNFCLSFMFETQIPKCWFNVDSLAWSKWANKTLNHDLCPEMTLITLRAELQVGMVTNM